MKIASLRVYLLDSQSLSDEFYLGFLLNFQRFPEEALTVYIMLTINLIYIKYVSVTDCKYIYIYIYITV